MEDEYNIWRNYICKINQQVVLTYLVFNVYNNLLYILPERCEKLSTFEHVKLFFRIHQNQ